MLPSLSPDCDRVLESGGGYKRNACAFAFEQGIGSNRGAVADFDTRICRNGANCLEH
jgi:hypothetical protein